MSNPSPRRCLSPLIIFKRKLSPTTPGISPSPKNEKHDNQHTVDELRPKQNRKIQQEQELDFLKSKHREQQESHRENYEFLLLSKISLENQYKSSRTTDKQKGEISLELHRLNDHLKTLEELHMKNELEYSQNILRIQKELNYCS